MTDPWRCGTYGHGLEGKIGVRQMLGLDGPRGRFEP